MDDNAAAQLDDAMGQLASKSGGGARDAEVSGGAMRVQAGGPVYFNGISACQNQFVNDWAPG